MWGQSNNIIIYETFSVKDETQFLPAFYHFRPTRSRFYGSALSKDCTDGTPKTQNTA